MVLSWLIWLLFQSTLPLRGATDWGKFEICVSRISIHAPLAGSDFLLNRLHDVQVISIHAPLAGSDCINGHPKSIE